MNRMNDLNCLLAEKLVEDIKKDYEAKWNCRCYY